MSKPTEVELEALFEQIAREELRVETLKTRNRDSLDFHDVGVWNIRRAINRAFNEGLKVALKQMPAGVRRKAAMSVAENSK